MANSKRQCSLKSCKLYFRPEDGIIVCGGKLAFCCFDHQVQYGLEMGKKLRQQQAKLVKREDTRRKKEFRENDYKRQLRLTKKAAQKLAVLLDSERCCISCDRLSPVVYCGGHYRTAGAHPELAVDLRNIHKQCNMYCNCGLSGNIEGTKTTPGFREGLRARYGQPFVDYLETGSQQTKLSCDQLMSIRSMYNAEIRRLEKGLPPSRNWRDIPQAEQMRGAA